jgi:hypothetical protein
MLPHEADMGPAASSASESDCSCFGVGSCFSNGNVGCAEAPVEIAGNGMQLIDVPYGLTGVARVELLALDSEWLCGLMGDGARECVGEGDRLCAGEAVCFVRVDGARLGPDARLDGTYGTIGSDSRISDDVLPEKLVGEGARPDRPPGRRLPLLQTSPAESPRYWYATRIGEVDERGDMSKQLSVVTRRVQNKEEVPLAKVLCRLIKWVRCVGLGGAMSMTWVIRVPRMDLRLSTHAVWRFLADRTKYTKEEAIQMNTTAPTR